METLPDTLHGLLRVGLDDLRLCEADPGYTVDMNHWHLPSKLMKPGTCLVCVAGAVMAKTLGVPPDWYADDTGRRHVKDKRRGEAWPEEVRYRSAALDCLREGDVVKAAQDLGLDYPLGLARLNRAVCPYEDDREVWWEDVEQLYIDLKREGL